MSVGTASAQYTIYNDAVVIKDKDGSTYTLVDGKENAATNMNRAFSVSASVGYESKSDLRIGGEVAYLWNKRTETALTGSYGTSSKEAAFSAMQRFYTNPAQTHNWTFFVGAGVELRNRKYAFEASDEVKASVEGAAVEAGYNIYDDNNHQWIISPMVEVGAKVRVAKNLSLTATAYCGYETNKACESFVGYGNHNGTATQFTVPTTADNRGFYAGVKVSVKVSFAKGKKGPRAIAY